jgi:hypothetical protein
VCRAPEEWQNKLDLTVPQGQLTFDAEGGDIAGSRIFSRILHHPTPGSGVTIGRGYDMKDRNANEIYSHFIAAGIDEKLAVQASKAAGLSGKEAEQFVVINKAMIGTITREQQKILFEISYAIKKEYAIGFYKRATAKLVNAPKWQDLDLKIQDVAIDFAYQGTNGDQFRMIATNDPNKIINYINTNFDSDLYKFSYQRGRIAYLRGHVK